MGTDVCISVCLIICLGGDLCPCGCLCVFGWVSMCLCVVFEWVPVCVSLWVSECLFPSPPSLIEPSPYPSRKQGFLHTGQAPAAHTHCSSQASLTPSDQLLRA